MKRLGLSLVVAAVCALGPACKPPPEPARSVPRNAALSMTHGDARVGTYVSSPWGFETASYWIEGPDGLILIDTQFLLSAAGEMVDWAEAVTGKKAELAIVTHANPDKYNGTNILRERGIRVVTSKEVRDLIPKVHEKRLKAFYDRYKPDYPKGLPLPDDFGDDTTELTAAGLTVRAHVMGAGCSEAHVTVEWEGHIFAGDLVASRTHSWLEIGQTDAWLARIGELERLKPRWVHPGRGPSGGVELLAAQRAYLQSVISIVAEAKPHGAPDLKTLSAIKSRIVARWPGYEYDVFLDIGLPAEWARQARHESTLTDSAR